MKLTLFSTLVWMQVCIVRNYKLNKDFLRIMGGRNATEDEFPYVVKLLLQFKTKTRFICSSAVLTSKCTLTAGHCIKTINRPMSKIKTIKAFIEYQPSAKANVVYSEVMTTALHPGINLRLFKNDIGLLYTQPILLSKYGKLSPLDYASLFGQEVSIVGYGMINSPNEGVREIAQDLEAVAKHCDKSNLYPQICFARSCSMRVQGTMSLCGGDSGGPAIHASGIIVIISLQSDLRNCGKYRDGQFRRERYETGYELGVGTVVSPYIG